ncbi:hypothetical protein GYH30_011904 [Glycine max]|uniref:kinesin-like protein KIP2 n=1 Tax=Glycine max TaxID=3847 RepID=UPI000E21B513|nr:kinesin-like protein KIP2 [Glycine max]XP_028230677.1 kinesin-like protein KIP2 [Glycine soja]KAH1133256.1 hypothetical protein GYH30_011904 [Glycine max]|eukprot:XP_025984333.1 kinesin-like protein KIP2 [Glycine max]
MNQIDDGRTLSPLLDQAPENVLESVLHFLTSRHDRNAASLVYKSWYHAEALTRTELFIKNCYVVSPHRASTQFPRVWSVTINGKPCFADFDLMPLNWGSTSPLRPPHSPKLTTHSSTNSTSNTCPSLTMTSTSSPTPSPPSKTSFSRAVKALAPPLLPPSPLTTVRLVVVLQSIVGKHINRVFTFDKVFGPSTQQMDLYEQVVTPIVNEVLEGFNYTIFAYGQTGTGKIYTMEGKCKKAKSGPNGKLPLGAGVIPRVVK